MKRQKNWKIRGDWTQSEIIFGKEKIIWEDIIGKELSFCHSANPEAPRLRLHTILQE
jgi:hypothetical protein